MKIKKENEIHEFCDDCPRVFWMECPCCGENFATCIDEGHKPISEKSDEVPIPKWCPLLKEGFRVVSEDG